MNNTLPILKKPNTGKKMSKEYGSDFHFCTDKKFLLLENKNDKFLKNNFSYFFSGRSALFHILKQGIENENWSDVYFPSYYCHEVVEFVKNLPVKLHYYKFNPFLDNEKIKIKDKKNIVIINVNFFGIVKIDFSNYIKAIIIDDLTHDILSYKHSNAHYCFASLRKELPCAVGGFCFSPKKKKLPKPEYNIQSEKIAIIKLYAMALKSNYLLDQLDSKNEFRELFEFVEKEFKHKTNNTMMPKIAKEMLCKLNITKIKLQKSQNVVRALLGIKKNGNLELNIKSNIKTSLGLILKCKDKENRNSLRQYLIKNNIFPAILWPNQKNKRDILIENTTLFIHLDYRYNQKNVNDIVNKINTFYNDELYNN